MVKKGVIVCCGAFSPITYGHLRMFEMAKDKLTSLGWDISKGIISPVSDHYWKKGMLKAPHRVEMCKSAVSDSEWIFCDDWESKQDAFTPTAQVLQHYSNIYNYHHIFLLGGTDLINSFSHPEWWAEEDIHTLTGHFTTVAIERKEFPPVDSPLVKSIWDKLVHIENEVPNDISSTKLRRMVSEGRSIKYLTSDSVIRYIKDCNLYRNTG